MAKERFTYPERATKYLPMAAEANVKYGLPPGLMESLLYQESRYRPEIINGELKSSAGAEGIAQIVPKWHPDAKTMDPAQSIDYAASYMAKLLKQFGNMEDALAAYNWGPGNVSKGGTRPKETTDYTTQIMGRVNANKGGRTPVAFDPRPESLPEPTAPREYGMGDLQEAYENTIEPTDPSYTEGVQPEIPQLRHARGAHGSQPSKREIDAVAGVPNDLDATMANAPEWNMPGKRGMMEKVREKAKAKDAKARSLSEIVRVAEKPELARKLNIVLEGGATLNDTGQQAQALARQAEANEAESQRRIRQKVQSELRAAIGSQPLKVQDIPANEPKHVSKGLSIMGPSRRQRLKRR